MRPMFKTMFKGAQFGAMFISFFILMHILINPNHMILLYEFNVPLLWLEVIVFGVVVGLSLIELGFHVKKEGHFHRASFNKRNFSKLKFFSVFSLGVFTLGICLWLQKLGIFT